MPPFEYNDPVMKVRRQTLRNRATMAEMKLWEFLRHSQFRGLKFRRQYGVGPYVLDFYCAELRLCIEVDGDSHCTPEAQEYDRQRQSYIEGHGITVARFSNDDVICCIDDVMAELKRVISSVPRLTPPT